MSLVIAGHVIDPEGTALVGVAVLVTFDNAAAFADLAGAWDSQGRYGLSIPTDTFGAWSWPVPFSAIDPSNTTCSITLPNGVRWSGVLPLSHNGTLSLKDLKDSYSWGLVSAPSATVVAVQGPAGASGLTAGADVLFSGSVDVADGVLVDLSGLSTWSLAMPQTALSNDTGDVLTLPPGFYIFQWSISGTCSVDGALVIGLSPVGGGGQVLQYAVPSTAGSIGGNSVLNIYDFSVEHSYHPTAQSTGGFVGAITFLELIVVKIA